MKFIFLIALCTANILYAEELMIVKVPIYQHIIHEKSIYADVINHSQHTPHNGNSRSTNAHETAHGINSWLRNQYRLNNKKINGFYLLEGKAIILEEPNIKKRDIKFFVPDILRSYRWKNYFEEDAWDDHPLYVLDEWTCYIIGGKVSVEDVHLGLLKEKWSDEVSGCLDFSIYSLALCLAVKKLDPEYWHNNTQFKSLMMWQLLEANKTFLEGHHMEVFKSKRQDELLKKLLYSEEAQPFRELLVNEFKGAWLDDGTRNSVLLINEYNPLQK